MERMMNTEAMARAIYGAMNAERVGIASWDMLADDDSPTGPGRRSIRAWAEAAAGVAVDEVPAAETEEAPEDSAADPVPIAAA
jgi:hypothetical protein